MIQDCKAPLLQPNFKCPLPNPRVATICSQEHPAVSAVEYEALAFAPRPVVLQSTSPSDLPGRGQ